MGRFTDWLLGPVPQLEERAEAPARPPQGAGVMPPPPPSISERSVSAEQALGLDAVYRAVSIIATGVSQLSIDVQRNGEEIASPAWVRQPDIDDEPEGFFEETANSLALNGNAFWRVYRSPDSGGITNLRILSPLDVVVDIDPATGRRSYMHQGRELASREIKHLRLLRVPGHARGVGPIQAAQASVAGALDLRDYSAGWFRDSGVPTGVLSTDQALSPDQAMEYKERWNETQGGRRGIAVLGRGLDYRPILLSPSEAQFIESQQLSVTSLARLFGIPAHLVLASVEGGSQTYVNVGQADLTFVRWTLSRYTREIEIALSSLLPRGQRARFNLNALLRPDLATRYTSHKVGIEAGFLTKDEARSFEDLPPLTTGTEEGAA